MQERLAFRPGRTACALVTADVDFASIAYGSILDSFHSGNPIVQKPILYYISWFHQMRALRCVAPPISLHASQTG